MNRKAKRNLHRLLSHSLSHTELCRFSLSYQRLTSFNVSTRLSCNQLVLIYLFEEAFSPSFFVAFSLFFFARGILYYFHCSTAAVSFFIVTLILSLLLSHSLTFFIVRLFEFIVFLGDYCIELFPCPLILYSSSSSLPTLSNKRVNCCEGGLTEQLIAQMTLSTLLPFELLFAIPTCSVLLILLLFYYLFYGCEGMCCVRGCHQPLGRSQSFVDEWTFPV